MIPSAAELINSFESPIIFLEILNFSTLQIEDKKIEVF